jgi:hypothetical protein
MSDPVGTGAGGWAKVVIVYARYLKKICKMNTITVTCSKTGLLWTQSRELDCTLPKKWGVYQDRDILGFAADSGLTFDLIVDLFQSGNFKVYLPTTARLIYKSEIMSANVGGSPLNPTWVFRSHHDILRLRDQELCRGLRLHSLRIILRYEIGRYCKMTNDFSRKSA